MADDRITGKGARSVLKRFWPAIALVVVITAFAVFGPDNHAVFEALREHRETLRAFVANHAVLASLLYFVIYAVVVALSLPGGAMMTVAGGFLFGPLHASVLVVFSATTGATILFLIARTAVGGRLRARAGPWMTKMEAGFRANALSYLLVLRLIPLFPFFVVNLVPAFLGVSLRVYFFATLVGIIPGTTVYALAGSGLGAALDAGEGFDVSTVLTPHMIAALVGLGVLALLPVVYKKLCGGGDCPRAGVDRSGGEP